MADNLDLMCAVIEKAAMEKVTIEIDQALSLAFSNRKKHREQRPNQPYVDMETYQMSGFPTTLPQRLCPKPTGLLPSQLSVYEDFIRIPRSTPVPYDKPSAHLILERFAQCITELEKLANQTNLNNFNSFLVNGFDYINIRPRRKKTMLAFAIQLSQQSIFKVEEVSSLFYRVCIEVSVDHAIKFKMIPGQSTAYQPMDAFSKLIMTLIQVPEAEQMSLFTRALSVIVLVR